MGDRHEDLKNPMLTSKDIKQMEIEVPSFSTTPFIYMNIVFFFFFNFVVVVKYVFQ
jgi:hypothetical protein